jgi:site-specific recombinase XerD
MGWLVQTSSGKWQPRYRLEGKVKSGPSQTYQHQAEAWLAQNVAPAGRQEQAAVKRAGFDDFLLGWDGRRPVDSDIRLGDYAATWLRSRHGIASTTRKTYRTHVTAIISDAVLSPLRLADVERADVDAWLARMEAAGVKAPTRNARLKLLRMICTAATHQTATGLLRDPTAGIKREKTELKPRAFLSDDQLDDLLDAIGDDVDLRLAVLLAVDAGLRWSEITALAASSVTARGQEVTLRIWQSTDRNGEVRNTTKNGSERNLPVCTERLRKALSSASKRARLRGGPDALLLVETDGRTLRYENWTRTRLKPAFACAALHPEPQGWHDLRHTFESKLAERGVPTKIISTLMGHGDQRVTEVYMHASSQESLREALGRAMSGS